ncbi:MAG: aspartate 1-decarboxylase [Gemmataceae bacterium]
MDRHILKSKIHRVRATHADVDYEGSLTIDSDLMEAADILPYEQVHVWNVTQGTRFQTYAMVGESGSGVICANGAAAHLVQPGDTIIVATFTILEESKARLHEPKLVFVDEDNKIRSAKDDDLKEVVGPRIR